MGSLEEQFEAACAAGDIPGVVLVASDVTGEVFNISSTLFAKSPCGRQIQVPESVWAQTPYGADGHQQHVHHGLVHEADDLDWGTSVRREGAGRAR